MYNSMEFDADRRIIPLFMQFVCNLPRIMRLFDFGRNYAKNYASIIRQGLESGHNAINVHVCASPFP